MPICSMLLDFERKKNIHGIHTLAVKFEIYAHTSYTLWLVFSV
jgi:hypothetical protein